ncbi:bifunctional aconitate hydratase 2/2-methylisocitrate dehydratase [Granulosicoccus sp.]|nr:bifunctional aconitate hydratase 2/2-methylisocitrate dehydratase [Granulosicoccus sp.]MDB4224104.1 bifunctional aconitate hydratase 2/2-methylisocitrate dehydratase [Granulosicoccus sp.]
MLETYRQQVVEREAQGVVPQPLSAAQTADLVDLLKSPPAGEGEFLLNLLSQRIPAGVDEAAYVKAGFLAAVAKGEATSPLVTPVMAVELLGTMLGGYNIQPLIAALDDADLADTAVTALSHTLLMFDAFHDVEEKAKAGNAAAAKVIQSWADADWFLSKDDVPEKITVTVFKVPGETNTDDLSPATDAWSRPDIPLHAQALLKFERKGVAANPIQTIETLKEKGFPVAYVGDVVGTGSSRKSATNSVLWHMGNDIPHIPNRRDGGFVLGSKIAPIFYNTLEDAGALPIECDVNGMETGDVIDIFPGDMKVTNHESGEVLSTFEYGNDVLLDEVRAGGRIPLIIGRGLTDRARESLGLEFSTVFRRPGANDPSTKGYTLAQKIVGKACGIAGVRPGQYCEPKMTTVGSQDTTGPMTRDELKDLACLGFSADLVMQSFCHTAAYPKPIDVDTHHSLPDFMSTRGGVSLRPGDGIIHSWLNRMLLPDTVGTGGDSHTRFPMGISFPAGSGLVAFASAVGVMPLNMPESVLVRFKGEMQPGITLRDLVNAIPYAALKRGLLTVEKKGKKNVFSGACVEIEGLRDLKLEQAFELADATAERSAGGCTIKLDIDPLKEYITSNVTLLRWMIDQGYDDARTLERRARQMEDWLANPSLLEADSDAEYSEIIEIDLNEIKEPLLACPNDPDDVKPLSEIQGVEIDEVFIGSCMTNIGHYRAAGKLIEKSGAYVDTVLWIAPPTRMDEHQLKEEGYYNIFGAAGARLEIPGCSLCMGNQARVKPGATVVSTSTRNFPNRLGAGANVYLSSAELAAVAALLGRLPTVAEYMDYVKDLDAMSDEVYRYLNFNEIADFQHSADEAKVKFKDIPVSIQLTA